MTMDMMYTLGERHKNWIIRALPMVKNCLIRWARGDPPPVGVEGIYVWLAKESHVGGYVGETKRLGKRWEEEMVHSRQHQHGIECGANAT